METDDYYGWYVILEDCRTAPVGPIVGNRKARNTHGPFVYMAEAQMFARNFTKQKYKQAYVVRLVETWPKPFEGEKTT